MFGNPQKRLLEIFSIMPFWDILRVSHNRHYKFSGSSTWKTTVFELLAEENPGNNLQALKWIKHCGFDLPDLEAKKNIYWIKIEWITKKLLQDKKSVESSKNQGQETEKKTFDYFLVELKSFLVLVEK